LTDDCGATIKGLNSGTPINEFMFHPIERSWALAAAWKYCDEEDPSEECENSKELYLT